MKPKEFELRSCTVQPAANGFLVNYHGTMIDTGETIERMHVALAAPEALGYVQWALTGRIFRHDEPPKQ